MTGIPSVSNSSYGLGGFGYTEAQQPTAASPYSSYSSSGYSTPLFNQGVAQPAAAPKKEKKGFFGKVFGAVKSVVKGATVGLGKAIVNTLKDPKKLLLAAGAVALSIAFPPAGIALAAAGVAMAGKTVVENGVVAAQAYASGNDELAEAALENVGTGLGAGALSVAGVKASVGAAAAKGVNEGVAGGLNVSSKLANKIASETAEGGTISTTTAVRAGFSNTYQGFKTGFTNFRSGVSAARAEGASLTQAVTQTARGTASEALSAGRTNFTSTVQGLRFRNFGGDTAKMKSAVSDLDAQIAKIRQDNGLGIRGTNPEIQGLIQQRNGIQAQIRSANADLKVFKGNEKVRTALADERAAASTTADDAAGTTTAATTADDAAAATTKPSLYQRVKSGLGNGRQITRDLLDKFRRNGTTGDRNLDARITEWLKTNPTAQRVVASKPGTLVADFNTIRPGVIPALGGVSPFNLGNGQLDNNAIIAAVQANPFILQQA